MDKIDKDYRKSEEFLKNQPKARLFAFLGIVIVAIVCYYSYYFYNKGKIGIALLVSIFAILGLMRSFIDIKFVTCTPSFYTTLTGGRCGGKIEGTKPNYKTA
jgi:hypothetical protein